MAALQLAFNGPFNAAKNNLKVALDTRNVFLNLAGQDRTAMEFRKKTVRETNLPYDNRMRVI